MKLNTHELITEMVAHLSNPDRREGEHSMALLVSQERPNQETIDEALRIATNWLPLRSKFGFIAGYVAVDPGSEMESRVIAMWDNGASIQMIGKTLGLRIRY